MIRDAGGGDARSKRQGRDIGDVILGEKGSEIGKEDR